jgi:uncharacterized protein (DUF488 family)
MNTLYTIGHSTHTIEHFLKLLVRHSITAVCDVRSSPYSSYNPQFNRNNLMKDLKQKNITYVYLGEELGPRSDDPQCYLDNKIQYDLIAKTQIFQDGLNRIREGMKKYRIALMCAEKDPIMCHRTILVCRHLRGDDLGMQHILEDGSIENNTDSEKRLMRLLKVPQATLFDSPEELIAKAYDIQGQKIAHTLKQDTEAESR